jgi:hypothetical protein
MRFSLTLLATARAAAPDSVWPAYLLGRRLYYAQRFDEAIAALQPVLQSPLPEDIRLATIELIAWSFLRSAQPLQARQMVIAALEAPHMPWTDAERLRLEDLQRRAAAVLP